MPPLPRKLIFLLKLLELLSVFSYREEYKLGYEVDNSVYPQCSLSAEQPLPNTSWEEESVDPEGPR